MKGIMLSLKAGMLHFFLELSGAALGVSGGADLERLSTHPSAE